MPTAITVRLLPDRPGLPDTKQLHGLGCALFERGVAHHAQRKPFTLWPLCPDPVDPEAGLLLRASWLPDTPLPFDPDELSKVRLGSRWCTVTGVDHQTTTYAALAAGPPVDGAEVTFRSPTFFAANGRRTVAPELRLILGGYRRRWNEGLPADSELRLDDDVGRELQRAVEFRSFALRTVKQDGGHGHSVTGFTGKASMGLMSDATPEVWAAFGALLRFAPYCGTGARTTYGFGATRVVLPTGACDGS